MSFSLTFSKGQFLIVCGVAAPVFLVSFYHVIAPIYGWPVLIEATSKAASLGYFIGVAFAGMFLWMLATATTSKTWLSLVYHAIWMGFAGCALGFVFYTHHSVFTEWTLENAIAAYFIMVVVFFIHKLSKYWEERSKSK